MYAYKRELSNTVYPQKNFLFGCMLFLLITFLGLNMREGYNRTVL